MSHLERLLAKQISERLRSVPAGPDSDQQGLPGTTPRAASAERLLCHRDVLTRPDYREVMVAVLLPSEVAFQLARLLPDPISRDALTAAAHTIAREEQCVELDRRDLLRHEL